MKHFLDIEQLSSQEIMGLIRRALLFKTNSAYPAYPQFPVVNLFYENSTRTRVSFELAAKQLSMPVVNLDLQSSSENKGEVITDTVQNLAAMGIKIFVIRHGQNGLPNRLAETCQNQIHIVNAGDGTNAHPSQAMLDMMTIVEQKPDLKNLKITIVGNIRHSRVANSLQWICTKLNVGELVCVAPKLWQPSHAHYGRVTTSLQEGLQNADVVIVLRVQQERILANEQLDLAGYRHDYALTTQRLKVAKTDAMIMHPGPINRGVEIDDEVADGPQSHTLQQVRNGVFMRMAILEHVIL